MHDALRTRIAFAGHAPMGGDPERDRWSIVEDADLGARIGEHGRTPAPRRAAAEVTDLDRRKRPSQEAGSVIDEQP